MQHCLFFRVHATVSFFSSLAEVAGSYTLPPPSPTPPVAESAGSGGGGGVLGGGDMEQAEDVFTTARHTKHTDVKDGTLVGIQFLIGLIAGAPPPPCPDTTEFAERPSPLVVVPGGRGLSHPSVCRQQSHQRFEELTLRHFPFFWALKKDFKKPPDRLLAPPLGFLSGAGAKQGVSSSVTDDRFFCHLFVRTLSKQKKEEEEEGNHPLVKPQRVTAGSAWFRPRPLHPLHPTSVPSSWHQLWHHNVYGCYTWNTSKPICGLSASGRGLKLQYSMWTTQTGFFFLFFVCLFEEINASS